MREWGRWFQRDPVQYVDSMNLYSYVDSRPLLYVDPFGEAMEQCEYQGGDGPSQLGSGSGGGSGCQTCMSQQGSGGQGPTVPPGVPVTPRVTPYPTMPCNALGRQAACTAWANRMCQARGAWGSSPACIAACARAAASCCADPRNCNLPGSSARCTNAGMAAMGFCNSVIPSRKLCWTTCMAGVMGPGGPCGGPCAMCYSNASWPTVISCITGCTLVWLPGVPPILQMPYRTCVAGCFASMGHNMLVFCPCCAGCVLSQAYICASGCGY